MGAPETLCYCIFAVQLPDVCDQIPGCHKDLGATKTPTKGLSRPVMFSITNQLPRHLLNNYSLRISRPVEVSNEVVLNASQIISSLCNAVVTCNTKGDF